MDPGILEGSFHWYSRSRCIGSGGAAYYTAAEEVLVFISISEKI